MKSEVKRITTPVTDSDIASLEVGDMIEISGYIFTGRDAVLPKITRLIEQDRLEEYGIELKGSVIFHTAVSPAGVGPTSSNKLEIEGNFHVLSSGGVRIHLGKGAISEKSVSQLDTDNAVYAVMPPVTALLNSRMSEQKVAAFPELGMEALHIIKVEAFPAIIAAAHGKSVYEESNI